MEIKYIEKMMERFNSGESKTIFRNYSCIVIIGLPTSGRKAWQEEEENKKIYQYSTDSSGIIVYLRALQGHSGRNLIDPTLQDTVVIPSNFFQYIYHVGWATNLHSIINSGLILGGSKFEQQTDSILSACGSHGPRIIRILRRSTRMHRVMHNTIC